MVSFHGQFRDPDTLENLGGALGFGDFLTLLTRCPVTLIKVLIWCGSSESFESCDAGCAAIGEIMSSLEDAGMISI